AVPSEVIVADDSSTDRTAEIARQHGARVVSVQHRQISATRNAGAHAAQETCIWHGTVGKSHYECDSDSRKTTNDHPGRSIEGCGTQTWRPGRVALRGGRDPRPQAQTPGGPHYQSSFGKESRPAH